MNQENNLDTKVIGNLLNIRSEIITRLGEITLLERRREMWNEFRESDYHGDH